MADGATTRLGSAPNARTIDRVELAIRHWLRNGPTACLSEPCAAQIGRAAADDGTTTAWHDRQNFTLTWPKLSGWSAQRQTALAAPFASAAG